MKLLFNILKNLVGQLIFFGLVGALALFAWNVYKDRREARTFVTSFSDIEGLRKGAQVFYNGVLVGKVIRIFPLGNTGQIGVKAVITDKDYPAPRSGVNARILTNYESGGGKILEVDNLFSGIEEDVIHAFSNSPKKGEGSLLMKNSTRLMRNFFQLSKDWANDVWRMVNSREAKEYQENLAITLENTVTSFEYGTVKQDVKNSIEDLNKEIKKYEKQPDKAAKTQRVLESKANALKNTVKTFGSLADVYK